MKTKELCYLTLVRPLVEYSSIIWYPFTDANIRKLEMVQRRSAKMVFLDYRRTSSATTMLHQVQWPSFQERRIQAKVTIIFRIINGLVEIPTTHLTSISSNQRTWASLPGTLCKNPVLPEIHLPRHHPALEQPSPDSRQLCNPRQLQEGSAASDSTIDPYMTFLTAL